MASKYRRLLQPGVEELQPKQGKEQHVSSRPHRSVTGTKGEGDFTLDDIQGNEEDIERVGRCATTSDALSGQQHGRTRSDRTTNTLSAAATATSQHRFVKQQISDSRAVGSIGGDDDHTPVQDLCEDTTTHIDTANGDVHDDEEEEVEEEGDLDGSDTAKLCGLRLYSCDACPHAVFTTHAALLAHAEERHADLVPDHARLRRIAEKLSPVWSRALKARRDAITMWGKRIFAVATQRDAGEAKMREAHRAREQLEIVVRRWHDKARVFIFGSSVAMGVWDGMADIDFSVVDVEAMEAGNWPPLERNAVRSITELLRRAGFSFVNLEPISHARVPIIKHHASSPIITVARKDAEDVVARSVRFVLNAPSSREDRLMLEGSVRDAVGVAGVQQVWWNRTGDVMSMTLDSTTTAIRAAMCTPAFVTPSMRAKVQPVHDECRPELYNIDFDLSFRAFGIRNSNLLRQYLMGHPCARPGAIVLKDWSKTSGVNNSVNGYFTSYAINIMWIYYLIQKGYVPYVDPLDIPASLVDSAECDPKYAPIMDPNLTQAQLDALYRDAGDMLVGFFYFYSFEFDWEHHVVSLNRHGITTKKMLGWHTEDVVPPMSTSLGLGGSGGVNGGGAGSSSGSGSNSVKRHPTRYELCIEDPYEENLNLGRHIGVTKSLRVRTELYRGLLSLLKDGEGESCVFASTDLKESVSGVESPSSGLPARALFKLMALVTQAVAESRQLPGVSDGNAVRSGASSAGLPLSPSTPSATGIIGVPEKQLESIFLEKAHLEFQLARKVWNWHQLIHRLGYKIHHGHVLPRREVGVRCVERRNSDGSLNDASSTSADVTTSANGVGGGNGSSNISTGGSNKKPGVQGRNLTENILRDLSRGFMTLTPEWVAWSMPWASQHMRGYSRLTPLSGSDVTASTTSNATPEAAAPSSGEVATGPLRGTRRNSAPVMMMKQLMVRTPVAVGATTTITTRAMVILARIRCGVKRVVPFKRIR